VFQTYQWRACLPPLLHYLCIVALVRPVPISLQPPLRLFQTLRAELRTFLVAEAFLAASACMGTAMARASRSSQVDLMWVKHQVGRPITMRVTAKMWHFELLGHISHYRRELERPPAAHDIHSKVGVCYLAFQLLVETFAIDMVYAVSVGSTPERAFQSRRSFRNPTPLTVGVRVTS